MKRAFTTRVALPALIFSLLTTAFCEFGFADAQNIHCDRKYYDLNHDTQVDFNASLPCCTGIPEWKDCREQGGIPVSTTTQCSFGNSQGHVWKCSPPSHKSNLDLSQVYFTPEDDKAWLGDLPLFAPPAVQKTNQCSPQPSEPSLPAALPEQALPTPPISAPSLETTVPALTNVSQIPVVVPPPTLTSAPVAPAPSLSSTPATPATPAPRHLTLVGFPDEPAPPSAQSAAPKVKAEMKAEVKVAAKAQPKPETEIKKAIVKTAPEKTAVVPAPKHELAEANPVKPASPKPHHAVRKIPIDLAVLTAGTVSLPVSAPVSSAESALFQSSAADFKTSVAGIFATGVHGLEKFNTSRSSYLWYGDITKDPKELNVGTGQAFDAAQASSSVVQLGLDGYSTSLLADLKNCPGDGVSVSDRCKNLILWKKMIQAHPGVTVYLRPFAELNQNGLLDGAYGRQRLADTWNALGHFMKDGPDGLKNVKMILSPLATYTTNVRNAASITNVQKLLPLINPKYLDAFGLNVYSRTAGSLRRPSFATIAQPWVDMYNATNKSLGLNKPIAITETGISRLPIREEVAYLCVGSESSECDEKYTFKGMIGTITDAIHLSIKGNPAPLKALRAEMKQNMREQGNPNDGVDYVDQVIALLTPGNPAYKEWDHERATWIKDAFAYAKSHGFPVMAYFKLNYTDWDAELNSETMNTLVSETNKFKDRSL